ncbi:hypothetical protein J6524_34690 [Bradyrhizobium sp. WSM 1738]|nr:hypothetical protein [Bradyrhizobium hereditatis]
MDGKGFRYRSGPHVTGHVASSYCTSPFAKPNSPILPGVGGGMFPRPYCVEPRGARFLNACSRSRARLCCGWSSLRTV